MVQARWRGEARPGATHGGRWALNASWAVIQAPRGARRAPPAAAAAPQHVPPWGARQASAPSWRCSSTLVCFFARLKEDEVGPCSPSSGPARPFGCHPARRCEGGAPLRHRKAAGWLPWQGARATGRGCVWRRCTRPFPARCPAAASTPHPTSRPRRPAIGAAAAAARARQLRGLAAAGLGPRGRACAARQTAAQQSKQSRLRCQLQLPTHAGRVQGLDTAQSCVLRQGSGSVFSGVHSLSGDRQASGCCTRAGEGAAIAAAACERLGGGQAARRACVCWGVLHANVPGNSREQRCLERDRPR